MTSHRTVGPPRRGGEEQFQGDLFTGKWEAKPPERGSGSHIRLRSLNCEKLIVPGMASYAGEGPAGKYCKDCDHFGEVAVQHALDKPEKNCAGCSIYAQYMGHAAAVPRRDIRFCAACKYFQPADEADRRFVVDQAGVRHRAAVSRRA